MIPAHQMNNIGFGYSINHPNEAVKFALEDARQTLEEAIHEGREMREWSHALQQRVEVLFRSAFKEEKHSSTAVAVIQFEAEISESIRSYFARISESMMRIKRLNPPLRAEQLDPYLESILADRRRTLLELDPISNVIEKLRTIKSWLAVQGKI